MTLDRVLATLGVLIVLPAFLDLFLKHRETEAALALLLGLVLIFWAILHRWVTTRPTYTILGSKIRLEILDADGARARLTKSNQYRANYPNQEVLIHRNIAADGEIANFIWNGEPVAVGDIEPWMGGFRVTTRISPPIHRGQTREGTLSYELINSFREKQEAYLFTADFPTKKAEIVVTLPRERRCRQTQATRQRGAGEVPHDGVEVKSDGCEISMTLSRCAVGDTYTLYWDW